MANIKVTDRKTGAVVRTGRSKGGSGRKTMKRDTIRSTSAAKVKIEGKVKVKVEKDHGKSLDDDENYCVLEHVLAPKHQQPPPEEDVIVIDEGPKKKTNITLTQMFSVSLNTNFFYSV